MGGRRVAEVSLWEGELRAATLPRICVKSGQPADANFTFEYVTLESPTWTLVSRFVRASLLPSRIGPVRASLPVTRAWLLRFAALYGIRILGLAVALPCLLLLWFLPQAPRLALASSAIVGSLISMVAQLVFSRDRPSGIVHRTPTGQLWIHLRDVHPNFVAAVEASQPAAASAISQNAGGLSPDRLWYWDGARWLSAISPDRVWRWDGAQWVPASESPVPSAPPLERWQPAAVASSAPSPGLRQFLLVVLVVTSVITGLLALFGLLGVAAGPGHLDLNVLPLFLIFVVLFALPVAATVGVVRRANWARVVAIIAGVAVSLTCLGLVLGIPIIIAAARTPLRAKASPITGP
jgi:hypothetical protein